MMMMQVQILIKVMLAIVIIYSIDAVVVAGIHLTFMLDKGGHDLQTFWNARINQTNVVFARTSPQQRCKVYKN